MNLRVIALIALMIISSYSIGWMIKQIQPYDLYCFKDDIPKHTRVLIQALTLSGQLTLERKYGHENTKYDTITQTLKTVDFTTQNYGVYGFCFLNKQKESIKIKFSFNIGKRAQDYSSNCQKIDLNQIQRLLHFSKLEIHLNQFNYSLQSNSFDTFDNKNLIIYIFNQNYYHNINSYLKNIYINQKEYIYQVSEYVQALQNQASVAQSFLKTTEHINYEGLHVMFKDIDEQTYGFVYTLSALFVLVSIILTFIQYKIVNKHLLARKYI